MLVLTILHHAESTTSLDKFHIVSDFSDVMQEGFIAEYQLNAFKGKKDMAGRARGISFPIIVKQR